MCATDVRVVLRNLTLWETTPDGGIVRTVVPDQDALLEVLSERFGLAFPAGTRFRALEAEGASRPAVLRVHHVQLGMPPAREAEAEAFYGAALGLDRVPKPPELEARGGRWFRGPDVEVHLGVEDGFRPSRTAHPAFVVRGLADMRERLAAGGIQTTDDIALAGWARCHVTDPFGNRIELIEPGDALDEQA
jgi:catechol 2,3-dioxygenase-like lactoylglutathione lyase family enzyme